MATVIRGTDNFDSSVKTGLGDGQTWQEMKTVRNKNVIYLNDSGRSIYISVRKNTSYNWSTVTISLYDKLGNYIGAVYGGLTTVSNQWAATSVVVPSGWSYKATWTDAVGAFSWMELR